MRWRLKNIMEVWWRWRFNTKLCGLALSVILLWYFTSPSNSNHGALNRKDHSKIIAEKPESKSKSNLKTRCGPPSLSPFNKDVLRYYWLPRSVNCPRDMNPNSLFLDVAFSVKNGHHLLRLVDMGLPCCYRPFFQNGDDSLNFSTTCFPILDEITVLPSNTSYMEVVCQKSGEKLPQYRDAFALVHYKIPDLPKNPFNEDNWRSHKRLNVLIIGFDAVSLLNFVRHMPLSRNYLVNSLGAINLEGYSVVGKGSKANLIPLLTGLSSRYYLTNRSSLSFSKCALPHPQNMTRCPLIWKEFSKRGYVTAFAEDWPIFGTDWPHVFSNPSTDYFLRPLAVHKQLETPARSHYCFGPRLAFEVVLDFVQSVREAAERRNQPYFQFSWTTRLGHHEMNGLRYGEVPLFRTLVQLKESGAMNSTVLMILGDHGYGTGYFETDSGQTEYRMPVAYIALPPWFADKYPEYYRNLKTNAKKMVTSYDIFQTLLHLLEIDHPKGHRQGRGVSLFQKIAVNRNCMSSNISPQWCHLCHPMISMKFKDPLVQQAAKFVVHVINELTDKSLCKKHRFRGVVSAFMWDSKDVLLELCDEYGNLALDNGYILNLNGKDVISCKLVNIVNVQVQTTLTLYHGEVLAIQNGSLQLFLTDDIQRIGRFAETGYCVPERMKPYCFCKKDNEHKVETCIYMSTVFPCKKSCKNMVKVNLVFTC